jgi:AcrR family transcriptional regulator
MGITIAYRGRLSDLTRIDDFEDRLVDLALEFGGQVQIWRSWADADPHRMVRGVILNLAPGQETTSLLVSPEGWLIGLSQIEDAELGRLSEPPLCFVKTQYGPVDGHVALVELFTQLKKLDFLPELEVWDDGGYWERRDLSELVRKHSLMQAAIDGLAVGLQQYGLSREAAEDPDILLRHVERVAARVHQILMRPAEHAPPEFADDVTGDPADPEVEARQWDELERENRRRQERIQRAIQEALSRGLDPEAALDEAMADTGAHLDEEERSWEWDSDLSSEAAPEAEPWREREDGAIDESFESSHLDADEQSHGGERRQHPLLRQSTALFLSLTSLCDDETSRTDPAQVTLYQGTADLCGGLAQALASSDNDVELDGLRLVQFKRALRGAAFARGSLFSLRTGLDPNRVNDLIGTLKQMEADIFAELAKMRRQEDEP